MKIKNVSGKWRMEIKLTLIIVRCLAMVKESLWYDA
jgi:hypothetical protein